MSGIESTDVLIIGSGFGGSIPAYHLAAGGAGWWCWSAARG